MGHEIFSHSFVCESEKDFANADSLLVDYLNDETRHDHYYFYPEYDIPGICKDEAAAHKIISQYYRKAEKSDDFRCFYTRFYQRRSSLQVKLIEKIAKAKEALDVFRSKHSVKNRKAATITCKRCNVRVPLSRVRNDECPCCGRSLLNDKLRDELRKREQAISLLESDLRNEERRVKKGEVRCQKKNDVVLILYVPILNYHF